MMKEDTTCYTYSNPYLSLGIAVQYAAISSYARHPVNNILVYRWALALYHHTIQILPSIPPWPD
jgi:hypothetical protein